MVMLGISSKSSNQRKKLVLGIVLAFFAFLLSNSPSLCGSNIKDDSRQGHSFFWWLQYIRTGQVFASSSPNGDTLLSLTTSCDIETGQEVREKEDILGVALGKEEMKRMTTLLPDVFYILIKFLSWWHTWDICGMVPGSFVRIVFMCMFPNN